MLKRKVTFIFLIEFVFCRLDPPVISLELGSKLQAGDIKEGDDVYFECRIDSNPKYRKLTWLQNVRLLKGRDTKIKINI
jgi:hypothetical protein